MDLPTCKTARKFIPSAMIFILLVISEKMVSQISLTNLNTPYNQDFNSLASSGTSNTLPAGWAFLETGMNANTDYTAGTGSSATGDTYSYGATANSERSLGELTTGTLQSRFGASFINNTGKTIGGLEIQYTGEQWRIGANGREDKLNFQYSLNATTLIDGTWTDFNGLDFIAPVTSGAPSSLNGNLVINRTSFNQFISNLSITNGSIFWIRWTSVDASSNDDGLGIDSFYLTATGLVGFSGTIFHKGNGVDGVKDVTMTLSGDDSDIVQTSMAGTYNLIASTGDDFVIKPTKNINHLNGVDVADATRISQHIAGNYLTDFYRKVSADVNKSSTISTVDAAIIKQALLGNPAALAILTATGSWRFVDTDFSPPGTTAFVVPAFPETRTYTGASGNYTNQDFYGVKTGDVLNNADPQAFTPEPIPTMVWMVRDRSLTIGEIIDVEFSVQDWKNIAAFQYAFNFDPSVLEFEDIEMLKSISDFSKEGNFGTSNVQNGELRVLFTEAKGSEVEDASKVFKLRFKVLKSDLKLSDVLSLSNTNLNPIAYTEELISTELKLIFTEGSVSNSDDHNLSKKIELLQNLPNPFSDFTTIGFILPTDMDAKLNIYDASGRIIWNVKKSYSAGYHEERIRFEGTFTPGVYFYELTTQLGSLTKRMILILE